MTVSNVSFVANKAATSGGAIYTKGIFTLSNATFTSNTVTGTTGQGGAIYNDNTTNNVKITSGSFTGNTANRGGAIYNAGEMKISSVTFDGNVATYVSSGYHYGGAIYNNKNLHLLGGNIFKSGNDNIFNNTTATLNISGSNTFGADIVNDGTINFATTAVTALTNGAKLNNRIATTQTLKGTLLDTREDVKNATADITDLKADLSDFYTGKWALDTDLKVGTTSSNAVAKGGSFVNDNGAKLWFGSYNNTTGVTDNTMEINSGVTEDYTKFKTFANLHSAYANFDGIINVTGGTISAKTFADDASLLLSGGNFGSNYVFGGKEVGATTESADAANKSVTIDGAITATKAIFAGNQFLSASYKAATLENAASLTVKSGATISAGSNSLFLVAGSLINGTHAPNTPSEEQETAKSGTVTDNGTHALTIEANIASKYLIGTNVVGGKRVVDANGAVTMNLAAGTYTCVTGAGYIQSNIAAISQDGDITMNITGGTYTAIYGGVAGSDASFVSHTAMTGDVNITVDTGTNAVALQYLFAGHGGNGSFTGDATITFTGLGSNLSFGSNESTVNGGNAVKVRMKTNATVSRSLVFDDFNGNFGAKYVEAFTDLRFSGGSMVSFASLDVKLGGVVNWYFENNTKLTWNADATKLTGDNPVVYNNFKNDDLVFGEAGDTLAAGGWTVIDGNDDCLFAGLGGANSVKIFGLDASYNSTAKAWCTSAGETNYKLFVDTDNHDLKIATLA